MVERLRFGVCGFGTEKETQDLEKERWTERHVFVEVPVCGVMK